jgi:hypothetical protein
MPTVLEAVGIAAPEVLRSVPQTPADAISIAYTSTQASAPSAWGTQLFDMMENSGIYNDGWMAGTLPKRCAWEACAAGDRKLSVGPNQREWSLCNFDTDLSTAAAKNSILAIHDYSQGTEGRPSHDRYRNTFTYHPGTATIAEDAAPGTIGKSCHIDADVTAGAGAEGVMIAQCGRFGGYNPYLTDGRPTFHYNTVGADAFKISADNAAEGTTGTLTLLVDGKRVGSGRLGRTVAARMSHTQGLDFGLDRITAVSPDFAVPNSALTGVRHEVRVTIK